MTGCRQLPTERRQPPRGRISTPQNDRAATTDDRLSRRCRHSVGDKSLSRRQPARRKGGARCCDKWRNVGANPREEPAEGQRRSASGHNHASAPPPRRPSPGLPGALCRHSAVIPQACASRGPALLQGVPPCSVLRPSSGPCPATRPGQGCRSICRLEARM